MTRFPKPGSPVTRRLRVNPNGWIVLETRSPGCINSHVAHDLAYHLEYKSIAGWVGVTGTYHHDREARGSRCGQQTHHMAPCGVELARLGYPAAVLAGVCPMTPREKTVVRAIMRSLLKNEHLDMNSFSMSYDVPPSYDDAPPKHKAAMLLQALLESES